MPKPASKVVAAHLPTALIAGAGGFVGSHLADVLVAQNCLVYGLDDWSTGKQDNLRQLLKNNHFVFLEQDLNQPLKISLPPIDYIFHLAGVEAYLNDQDISLETLLVNSLGTRQLLELARKKRAKFLLGSTVDIYSGFLSATDLNQYFSPERQREEVYSHHEAKRFSEALTYEYLNRYHLDARIVRFGHVYGPRQNSESGDDIARLFNQAINHQPLVIPGQGLKSVYPTYIADLIYGLTKAMFSQGSSGRIFTLINPQKTTVLNLANLIKKNIGNEDLKIEFDSRVNEFEPLALSRAVLESQSELGWQPRVSLEAGVVKTILWLKGMVRPKKFNQEEPESISAAAEAYSLEELGIKPAAAPAQAENEPSPVRFHFKLPKIHLPHLPNLSKLWNWEKIKFTEGRKSAIQGVPKNLPALLRAHRLQDKASKVGFDWDNKDDVWAKVLEEINELKDVEKESDSEKIGKEFGDVLFALVNYGRFIGVNPENALRLTNEKFIKRFSYIEAKLTETGKKITDSNIDEMNLYWEESKKFDQ